MRLVRQWASLNGDRRSGHGRGGERQYIFGMRLSMVVIACGITGIACHYARPSAAHSSPARVAIGRLIDSARSVGLPTAPLLSRVREGVLKGASDDRILAAVRASVRDEGQARSAQPRRTP
jgi:hypothetical protein